MPRRKEVTQLIEEVPPKKKLVDRIFWLAMLLCAVLLVNTYWLLSNPGVRFAIARREVATKFAQNYFKAEDVAQQASLEVLNNWLEQTKIE